jgi:hypothetical protein
MAKMAAVKKQTKLASFFSSKPPIEDRDRRGVVATKQAEPNNASSNKKRKREPLCVVNNEVESALPIKSSSKPAFFQHVLSKSALHLHIFLFK